MDANVCVWMEGKTGRKEGDGEMCERYGERREGDERGKRDRREREREREKRER